MRAVWLTACVVLAGALVARSVLSGTVGELVHEGTPVSLSGLDAAGRLEVPVINLWRDPGFVPGNQLAGRVALPADGVVDARLVGERPIGGVRWQHVRVGDTHGWVIRRFVRSRE
jgi:hypothetical protein